MNEIIALKEENKFMKFKLQKLQTNIDLIKQQLEVERNQNRELKTEKANVVSNKNELEEFFLECIEEVKKDISKRKDIQFSSKMSFKSTKQS